ncbi:MAG: hypothetical protein ACFHWX_02150 [Bacteroidota bacterium]
MTQPIIEDSNALSIGTIIIILIVLLLIILLIIFIPFLQTRNLPTHEVRMEQENKARAIIAQIFGGLALIGTLYFNYLSIEKTNEQLATTIKIASEDRSAQLQQISSNAKIAEEDRKLIGRQIEEQQQQRLQDASEYEANRKLMKEQMELQQKMVS